MTPHHSTPDPRVKRHPSLRRTRVYRGCVATVSAKITTAEKETFEAWCAARNLSVSSVLREFVRMAPKCRRFEVDDPEVGPPVGWLYLESGDA